MHKQKLIKNQFIKEIIKIIDIWEDSYLDYDDEDYAQIEKNDVKLLKARIRELK